MGPERQHALPWVQAGPVWEEPAACAQMREWEAELRQDGWWHDELGQPVAGPLEAWQVPLPEQVAEALEADHQNPEIARTREGIGEQRSRPDPRSEAAHRRLPGSQASETNRGPTGVSCWAPGPNWAAIRAGWAWASGQNAKLLLGTRADLWVAALHPGTRANPWTAGLHPGTRANPWTAALHPGTRADPWVAALHPGTRADLWVAGPLPALRANRQSTWRRAAEP